MGYECSANRPAEQLLSTDTLEYCVSAMPIVSDKSCTSIRNIGGKVMRKLTIEIPSDTYAASSGSDFERMLLL